MIRDNMFDEAVTSAAKVVVVNRANSKSTGLSSGQEASWSDVFVYRKAVIIGCGLMFFQTMTGINTVIFYSTTIFTFAGFSQVDHHNFLNFVLNYCEGNFGNISCDFHQLLVHRVRCLLR
jgi:hypothetical protein